MRSLFRTLSAKLVSLCLCVAIIPLVAVTAVTIQSINTLTTDAAGEYEVMACTIADKIDRNLFERYGDVQAFGLNTVVQYRDLWGNFDEEQHITRALNGYIDTYDIYYLTLLVDLNGDVIAVNTRDADAGPIDTTSLHERNFADAKWFQQAVAGDFYESEDGSFTGTVLEDAYVDEDVKAIYGDDGIVIGFTAPIRDAEGETIAVWKNYAKFSLVEDIVYSAYQDLRDRGLPSAELTILDAAGNILVDCDPLGNGVDGIKRDPSVWGKFNLADKGVEAAVRVVNGEAGSIPESFHARKKIYQVAGYAPFKGALGFPGMPWNMLVRVPTDEAFAACNRLANTLYLLLAITAAITTAVAYFFTKTLLKPIHAMTERARDIAQGEADLTKRLDASSSDELGELAGWFNRFIERVEGIIGSVAQNSQTSLAVSIAAKLGL